MDFGTPKWTTKLVCAVLSAAASLGFSTDAAEATVVLQDEYYGGLDTYNNPNDVIGDPAVFDISDVAISRVGAGGNTLSFVIDTNFAGKPGTPDAEGTGYGALFITPGVNAWHPTATGTHYSDDVYTPGEWQYAFAIPQSPNGSSGTAGLYLTSDGTVLLSNVFGNTTTYPFPGNPGYYFRQGQAVQFAPGGQSSPVATGTWSVGVNQLVLNITDNHLLGDNFALSWAESCANDIIQGQVSGVPESATWVMMIVGFGMIGFTLRRQSRVQASAVA